MLLFLQGCHVVPWCFSELLKVSNYEEVNVKEESVGTYEEVKYSKVGALSVFIVVRTCNFGRWCGEDGGQDKRNLLLE